MACDPDDPALFEQLSRELLAQLEQFLAKFHGFATFGGGITVEGEIVHLSNRVEDAEPEDDLRALAVELATPKWHVGMILVDTRVIPPGTDAQTDAVWVIAESRTGYIRHDFIPYAITGDGDVELGEPFQPSKPLAVIFS